jgi:hypothetical protein
MKLLKATMKIHKKWLCSLNHLTFIMFTEAVILMPPQTVWFGHYANNDFGGEKFTCKQGTQILNVRKFIFQVLICLALYCYFSPKVCQSDL